METDSGQVIVLEGFSTWVARGPSGEVQGKKTVIGLVWIGSQEIVPCEFDGDAFSHWPGTKIKSPNYIGILALGWSYILSARLVEIFGACSTMSYTDMKVMMNRDCKKDASYTIVDIGEVTEKEHLWWSAILASSQGWKAIIRHENREYLAPWSISVDSSPPFCVTASLKTTKLAQAVNGPLSSGEAFSLLCQFALRHNIESQLLLALTTAMTFPTHNFYVITIKLPLPVTGPMNSESISISTLPSEWETLEDELPYFITLSCSPELVTSSLCSMFWEPKITCNMVSPWLHPILNELPLVEEISSTPGLYHELLATICSLRRPGLSPL